MSEQSPISNFQKINLVSSEFLLPCTYDAAAVYHGTCSKVRNCKEVAFMEWIGILTKILIEIKDLSHHIQTELTLLGLACHSVNCS
jgi:hypothetical protein